MAIDFDKVALEYLPKTMNKVIDDFFHTLNDRQNG